MSEVDNTNPASLPLDQIICGDNCDVLGTFPRDCIDLVVTSPPYDNLRTYGGHDWHFERVALELWRVIKPGGVVVWVVADETIDGSETGESFRQAIRFKDIGFRLHDTMIYHKPHARFPRYNHRKYCGAWEYMFVLTNGSPTTFNMIRDIPNVSAGQKVTGTVRQTDGTMKDSHSYGRWCADVGARNNVWAYMSGYQHTTKDRAAFKHPAMFPESLAADHIRSWSNEGDIVLDPFNGSGTTTKMARELGRRYIGIDVSEKYCEIAAERLRQGVLF